MTISAPLSQIQPPARASAPAAVGADPLRILRLLIYSYFALWLLEGALRKWILPGLSGPLLIVRDPVLVLIYLEAIRQKVFKMNGWTTFILILGTLSTIVTIGLMKSPPIKVTIFGIHSNFLHLPLIFLIPAVLDYSHARKIGNAILWIAPFMAVLVALQFLSPSGARLNTGAGGEGRMIETALGRIRPSGTFSFTTGLAEYTALLAGCLLHQLLERKVFSRLAFLLAAPALLVMVVMSGSRTTFALVALQFVAMGVIWILKPRYLQSSVKVIAIGFLVVTVIGSVGALRVGMDVILERFGDKQNVKEGFLMRFVDEFKKPIDAASHAEPGGVGIGMGTNAASSMMYNMVRFNFGESEMDRIIMEMGPYLGFPYLLWRFAVVIFIVRKALDALRRTDNTFPLLLITACASDVVQGQFGQSTVVGFAVMIAGLSLASTNKKPLEIENVPEEETVVPITRRIRMAGNSHRPTHFSEPGAIMSAHPEATNPGISPYAARLRAEMVKAPEPHAPPETVDTEAIVAPVKKKAAPKRVRKKRVSPK